MRTTILLFVCLLTFCATAQEFQQQRTQVFSLTPFSKNVGQVNGVGFGIGNGMRYLWDDEDRPVTLNGLNVEINPLSPLIVLMGDPSKMSVDTPVITNNGLYIAAGGFLGNTRQNGVSVSLFNVTHVNNGIGITALFSMSQHLNGFHISGIANDASVCGMGVLIAPVNGAGEFTGLQVGVHNRANNITGLQIGLINKSNGKGFQIGLWNSNGKRSFPLINW